MDAGLARAERVRVAQPPRLPRGALPLRSRRRLTLRTAHKFEFAYRDHPRTGTIGLQDHGSPCWFKNIKLRPLPSRRFTS